MKFEEILAQVPADGLQTADQIGAVIDFLMGADDLSPDEEAAFMCGYFCGGTEALAAWNESPEKLYAFALKMQKLGQERGTPMP